MAPLSDPDRTHAWGLPDEFLLMKGPRDERVADLVELYWGTQPEAFRGRLGVRLLTILGPLTRSAEITDHLRDRCIAAVTLGLERHGGGLS